MGVRPPPVAPFSPNASRAAGWAWLLPAAVLLLGAVLLQRSLHSHWLDLVWAVRGLDEQLWSPALTRFRALLDAGILVIGTFAAALVLRLDAGWWRLVLAAVLLALGVLGSGLVPVAQGGMVQGQMLWWLALAGSAVLFALGFRQHSPARRWGELGLVLCLLLAALGAARSDLTGIPALFGSNRLGVWWNELGRPSLHVLGFVLFLLGAALAWLERHPGALRSGLARGAVFLGLAGFTALVYVGVAGGVGTLLGVTNSLWLGMLASALVAVGFGGARSALTRGVNRVLYGERDEPFLITRQLALTLLQGHGPRQRLEAALTQLTHALRLPGAALHLLDGEEVTLGQSGLPAGTWPLVVGGERVGTLAVQPRSAREGLSKADHRVLEAVADQLAEAAHAWQLARALQISHERLVRAGEDERRRLRRDLHDGLGPALSGLGLKLEAARLLLSRAPERAEAHLSDLQGEVRESVNEVRRLVHDLRPPKLDDLGLLGALDDLLLPLRLAGTTTHFEPPINLPPLSAASEVAVYRIAQEALTNVVKHAQARRVSLRLSVNGPALILDIEDDGVGLPAVREPGVGSRSMRERAEALSGHLSWLEGQGGGTLVRATLPLADFPT